MLAAGPKLRYALWSKRLVFADCFETARSNPTASARSSGLRAEVPPSRNAANGVGEKNEVPHRRRHEWVAHVAKTCSAANDILGRDRHGRGRAAREIRNPGQTTTSRGAAQSDFGSAPYRCNSGFLLRAVAMVKLGRNARLQPTDGRQADAQEWCWFTLLTEHARVRQLHGEEGSPGSHSAVGAKLAFNADHQKSTGRKNHLKYKNIKKQLFCRAWRGKEEGPLRRVAYVGEPPGDFGRLPRRASPSNQATLPALESQQNAHESGFWLPNAAGLLCLERPGRSTKPK